MARDLKALPKFGTYFFPDPIQFQFWNDVTTQMAPDKLQNNYEKIVFKKRHFQWSPVRRLGQSINDIGLFECAIVCYKHYK